MDVRVVLTFGMLLLAGCLGNGGADVSPTTSASHPPKPMSVFKKEINACPAGSDPPAQTTAITGRFEVMPGYDQIIIAFHESGTGGEISAEIRWLEESNQKIWEKPKHNIVPPTACPSHAHTGEGDSKTVEPGNYTVRIQYQGSVAIHMEVTARSSKAMETGANHTHDAR